jgi:hypothetical protein
MAEHDNGGLPIPKVLLKAHVLVGGYKHIEVVLLGCVQ